MRCPDCGARAEVPTPTGRRRFTTIERRSLAPDDFVARVAELGLHLADYEDAAT